MALWSYAEWAVFGLALMWAVSTNLALRKHYKVSNRPAIHANTIAMVQSVSVVVVAAVGCSPFHLVWLIAASYIAGIAPQYSKMIARVAWLYGYLFR